VYIDFLIILYYLRSGIFWGLRNVEWLFAIKVFGQLIFSILKGHTVREECLDQAKPNQSANEGGDLGEAQVDVSLFVSYFCV
jgi:hypothetical protein